MNTKRCVRKDVWYQMVQHVNLYESMVHYRNGFTILFKFCWLLCHICFFLDKIFLILIIRVYDMHFNQEIIVRQRCIIIVCQKTFEHKNWTEWSSITRKWSFTCISCMFTPWWSGTYLLRCGFIHYTKLASVLLIFVSYQFFIYSCERA